MSLVLAGPVGLLLHPDVLEHLLTIAKELVEEESVGDEHAEDDHEQVEELAEGKVEMVAAEAGLELHEVVGDCLRVGLVAEDVLEHASLEDASPEGARHLGEPEAEGEEEGKPEIVGGDGSVGLGGDLGLIHEASGGLALQVIPHIGSAVDPAVGLGIMVSALADNGSSVKMILQEDEQQSKHNNEGGGLVVKLEQGIVYGEIVSFEPFEQVADKRQSVDDCWSWHDGADWS